MENYVKNRNYLALYFNSIGLKFSSSLVLSFVGANLFVQGLPLYLIFLYFGLEFLARASFSPLSAVVVKRCGFKNAVVVSNVLLAIYFLWLSLVDPHSVFGFLSFLMHALARGIYYPTKHYLQASFVDNGTRGKFLTFEIVVTTLSAALAVSFAAYSVVTWQTFLPAALLTCVFLFLSSVAVVKLLTDLPSVEMGGYKDVVRNFASSGFRSDRRAFTGFGLNIGFNNVVVALLVFFIVDSLKFFGFLMASVFIAVMFLTLMYGSLIDKYRLVSNRLASLLQIGSYLSFLFVFNPLLAAVIKTIYDLVWNIFDSSFTARFHQKIMNRGFVYACSKEMTLGLSCGVYCVALAGIAYISTSQSVVFATSLMLSSAGVYIAWKNFSD